VEATLREPRADKVAVVEEIEARFEAASAALLTEYRGLPVKEVEVLRRALRSAGGEYKIYKNTLVRRAVAAGGYEALDALLTGPTAIAFVDGDVVAVAKVLRDFARTNPNLVVKGGVVGNDVLDSARAAALAELPSREVLLAQIAGLLAAPLQRFAGLLQAVPQKFAYALQALIESRPAEAAPEAAAPEAAAPEAVAPESAAPEAAAPAEAVEADAASVADAVEAAPAEAPADEAPAEEAPAADAAVAEAPVAAAPEADAEEAEAAEGADAGNDA
jgi:large subunit ribosomal protein L10